MSFRKTVFYDKNAELPYDFNWKIYVDLNKDLYGFSEKKAKQHYLLFGRNENRVYKYETKPQKTVSDNIYDYLNEDINEDIDANEYINENNYVEQNINNSNNIIYEDSHEYKEVSVNSVSIESLEYDVLNEVTDSNYTINDLWCHVHSNNPSEVIDNDLFIKLTKYFSVVITSESKIMLDMPKDFTILYVKNKHNIDTKNYVLKYLTDNNYDHDLLISMTY